VVSFNHEWIINNQTKTLTDLQNRLLIAHDQCKVIAEGHKNQVINTFKGKVDEPLKSELGYFWENSKPYHTFAYRLDALKGNLERVKSLIKRLGKPGPKYSLRLLLNDVYSRR
jgi:hypothetical protein